METTILTIEQMRDSYPDQWILVASPITNEEDDVIAGEVIAHSTDRDVIYDAIAAERQTRKGMVTIEYTGVIPDDVAFIL